MWPYGWHTVLFQNHTIVHFTVLYFTLKLKTKPSRCYLIIRLLKVSLILILDTIKDQLSSEVLSGIE